MTVELVEFLDDMEEYFAELRENEVQQLLDWHIEQRVTLDRHPVVLV